MKPSYLSTTGDPFDRGLISQAILGGMTIVTPDESFSRYPAPLLW